MNQLTIKKILVPLDFSASSLKGLDQAVVLAKLTNAEITLLHVIEYFQHTSDVVFAATPGIETQDSELEKATIQNLNQIAEKIKRKGIDKVKILSSAGRTYKEILRIAKKMKADIIVMGTHGVSGFREFVAGSNTYSVVRDSQCPVISVQMKNNGAPFKNILVPFSDRPHSREKVMYAIKIAALYGATLHVLGIDTEKSKAHAKKIILEAAQVKEIIEEHGVKCTVKVLSAPYNYKTVLSYATKINANLIVATGDVVKQDITEYFTGSFSQQIINHSPIPVLSIHSTFNPAMVELWHGI